MFSLLCLLGLVLIVLAIANVVAMNLLWVGIVLIVIGAFFAMSRDGNGWRW